MAGTMNQSARVVHVSSAHSSSDPRVFQKECRTLQRAGYDVVLIVPQAQDEIRDGVRITAVARPASRLGRFTRTGLSLLGKAIAARGSVYHLHDPDLIPLALVLKALGKRVVIDVHEDLAKQVRVKPWIPTRLRAGAASMAGLLDAVAGAAADAIVAATPPIASNFPPHKTVVVQNFPEVAELASAAATPHADRPNLVMYAGAITLARGSVEMVRAMGWVPVEGSRLALAGQIDRASLEQCRRLDSFGRVDLLGQLGRAELAALLGRARVGLCVLHPMPSYLESYPTKLFEYMSAGLPVIASDFPLWRQIIDEARCGFVVDAGDPAAIGKAITTLLQDPVASEAMGQRGRQAVLERYNWSTEADKLLKLYSRLPS